MKDETERKEHESDRDYLLRLIGPCKVCGEPKDHIHVPGLRDLFKD